MTGSDAITLGMGALAGLTLLRVLTAEPNRTARRAARTAAVRLAATAPDLKLPFAGGLLSVKDVLTGLFISGATGSGKSTILKLLLADMARLRWGLFCPAAKPGDLARYRAILAACGRTDVTAITATGAATVNFLGSLVKPGLDTRDNARRLLDGWEAVGECVTRLADAGQGDAAMWVGMARALLLAVFELALLAGAVPTVGLVDRVLASTAKSPADVAQPRFRAGECGQLLERAFAQAEADPALKPAADRVALYFADVYPNIAEKTRSGIEAHVYAVLHALTGGVVERVLSAETPTLDIPAVIDRGGVILTGFNLAEDRLAGTAVNAALKYLAQLHLLTRDGAAGARVFALLVDELPLVVTRFDSTYASLQRSAAGPLVGVSQGIENLYAVYPGEHGKAHVDSLLGNLAVKLCCSPTPATAKFVLDDLIGQAERSFYGGGTQPGPGGDGGGLFGGGGGGRVTGNFSRSFAPQLTLADLSRLRTGGPGGHIDFLAHISGRDFGGRCWGVFTVRHGGAA